LLDLARHRGTPQSIVLRARIVLAAGDGVANRQLARALETSVPTALLWRGRYEADGWAGILEDRPRSGRPKQISADKEAAIVEATLKTKPHGATHWSVRTLAKSQGVSKATIQRIWRKYRLLPHRVESFKFSTDPVFVPKVREIVGLYLSPPDKAILLSVDEKEPDWRWIGRSRFFLCDLVFPNVRPTTRNVMRPLPSSPRSMCWTEPSSANVIHDIAIKSF